MKSGILVALVMGVTVVLVSAAWVWADSDQPAKGNAAIVNLELKNVSVKDAVDKLFEGTGLKYYIQAGVSGKIAELRLKGITFEQALKAIADAADLTYSVEDGIYGIAPANAASAPSRTAPTAAAQPASAPPAEQPSSGAAQAGQTQPDQAGSAGASAPAAQMAIDQTPGPVYYGQPAGPGYYGPYGYGPYPPVYQIGSVAIVGGWPPLAVAGGSSTFYTFGPRFPPPPGWVGPDVLRFLRSQYAIQSQPYFMPGPGF